MTDTTDETTPAPASQTAQEATADTVVEVTWRTEETCTYRTTISLADLLDGAAPDDMAEVEHLLAHGADLSHALAAVSLDDTALPGLEGDGAKAVQHACMSRDLISVDTATGRPSS